MTYKSNKNPPVVCLLATEETTAGILYAVYDVLNTTGVIYPELTAGTRGNHLIDVKIVANTSKPFRCQAGVLIEPHGNISNIKKTDVVIVCDIDSPIDKPPYGKYQPEIEWLKSMYASGAILASVCSGSLILAESGLLNGLDASGHWAYREMFEKYYPNVNMRPESVLTIAGSDERIITAGAVLSWQDLVLYLISRLCGRQQAVEMAKAYLMAGNADGQLPFAVTSVKPQAVDSIVDESQKWIAANYSHSNPVSQMITRSGLKPRTFARRFYKATGYQPIEYVHAIRIEKAKNLLENGDAKVDDVGNLIGYEDPTYFRRLFKRKTGITPASYRRKFQNLPAALTN